MTNRQDLSGAELLQAVATLEGLDDVSKLRPWEVFTRVIDGLQRGGEGFRAFIILPFRFGGAPGWIEGTGPDPLTATFRAYVRWARAVAAHNAERGITPPRC